MGNIIVNTTNTTNSSSTNVINRKNMFNTFNTFFDEINNIYLKNNTYNSIYAEKFNNIFLANLKNPNITTCPFTEFTEGNMMTVVDNLFNQNMNMNISIDSNEINIIKDCDNFFNIKKSEFGTKYINSKDPFGFFSFIENIFLNNTLTDTNNKKIIDKFNCSINEDYNKLPGKDYNYNIDLMRKQKQDKYIYFLKLIYIILINDKNSNSINTYIYYQILTLIVTISNVAFSKFDDKYRTYNFLETKNTNRNNIMNMITFFKNTSSMKISGSSINQLEEQILKPLRKRVDNIKSIMNNPNLSPSSDNRQIPQTPQTPGSDNRQTPQTPSNYRPTPTPPSSPPIQTPRPTPAPSIPPSNNRPISIPTLPRSNNRPIQARRENFYNLGDVKNNMNEYIVKYNAIETNKKYFWIIIVILFIILLLKSKIFNK